MTKKYAVYRILEKVNKDNLYFGSSNYHHKLIFLDELDTEEEAELYISQSTKYTPYTILPKYYQTHFE